MFHTSGFMLHLSYAMDATRTAMLEGYQNENQRTCSRRAFKLEDMRFDQDWYARSTCPGHATHATLAHGDRQLINPTTAPGHGIADEDLMTRAH